MAEESTTPDLAELVRRIIKPSNERDLDAVMAFYAPDSVWDMSPWGMGTHEGPAAIRGLNEDWFAAYEEWEIEPEEIRHLGNASCLTFSASTPVRLGALVTFACARRLASYGSTA